MIRSLLAVSAAVGALASPLPRTFVDAHGDSGGAPDVTAVDVTPGAQSVAFSIRAASASTWAGAAAILDIDADDDAATGDAGGGTGWELSYVLHSEHTELTLDRPGGVHDRTAATWRLAGS